MKSNALRVKHHFDKAALTYNQYGLIQYHIATQLAAWCDEYYQTLLDIGAGSGFLSSLLSKCSEHLFLFDISHELLLRADPYFTGKVQADFHQLPVQSDCCDAVASNMALHWAFDLEKPLQEIHRVLSPSGKLYFSVPLTNTFQELHQAGAAFGMSKNTFYTLEELKNIVAAQGFVVEKYMDDTWQLCFSSIRKILHLLKATGVTHVNKPMYRHLRGKHFLMQLETDYQQLRNANGQLPLTYHIGFIQARKI